MTQAPTPGPLSAGTPAIRAAIALFRSAIKAGEAWSEDCAIAYRSALTELDELAVYQAPTAPVEASGSEREVVDRVRQMIVDCEADPEGPLMLSSSVAAEHARDLRTLLNLRPQPSGETRENVDLWYPIKGAIARAMQDERDGKPCGCIIEAGCEARGYHDPDYAASGFLDAATDAVNQLLSARPLALGGQQGVTADSLTQSVTDETMRALLSCKGVGTGRAHLAAIITALSTTPARAEAQDEGAAGEDVAIIRDRLRRIWEGDTHLVYSGNPPEPSHDEEGPLAKLSTEAVDALNRIFPIPGLITAHPSPTPAADADRARIAVEALEPFVPVWAKLTGLSDGIDVRLDASFALQDATGRARGATCNPNLPKLTVGDFRKAHKALAALKSTAAKEGGE